MPELSGILPELRLAAAAWPVVNLRHLDQARLSDAESVALTSEADVPGLQGGLTEVREAHIVVDVGRAPIPARVYRNRRGAGIPGALVFFHGGAFCLGDLETDHLRCLAYCQHTGATVVSVDYPLAPEHPYPAGLEACIAAAEWVHANSRQLGIDPDRIGVGGESAGAALAAGVALALRDRGGFTPRCQLLLFPVTSYRQSTESIRTGGDSPAWNSRQNALMWRLYLGTEPATFEAAHDRGASDYAAPAIGHDLAGLAPALVVVAEVDPLRDEGLDYALQLQRAGVPVELRRYPGTFHVFDFAVPRADVSIRAVNDQVAFLSRHLGFDEG